MASNWTEEEWAAYQSRLKQPPEGAEVAPSDDFPWANKHTYQQRPGKTDCYCGAPREHPEHHVYAESDRLEAPIQAEMCQILREDGWEILITNPVSDRSKGRGFGTPGMADFLAMRPMKCLRLGSGDSIEVSRAVCEVLWVEAKSGKNRAEKHQAEWHRNQRAIGFLTWIANEDFPATVEGFRAHYRASGLARRRDL